MEYDIIIVGAGTAGCVLAYRLSENPDLSILLLEAGHDRNDDKRIYTPALNRQMWNDPEFDWQYVTEPQPGLDGRRINHPRGKVVGGSSAINSFALIYPSAAGMDAWADLGNPGWDWESIKPYFRKFQSVRAPSDIVRKELSTIHNDETIKSTDGPIQASFPLTPSEMQRTWVKTFRSLGLENEREALDGHAVGGGITTCHMHGDMRERSHAGSAYFEPIKGRKNLHFAGGATVKKLLFRKDVSRRAIATGVEYLTEGGSTEQAFCKREVLLAAGAFGSPALLELSGIGNPDILSACGIDVVHSNSNTGENLADHMRLIMSFEAADGVKLDDTILNDEAQKLYENSRTGPWAERACYSFAYMPLQPFLTDEERAELEQLLNKHLNDHAGLSKFEQKRNDFIRAMIKSPSEATTTAYLSRSTQPDPDGKRWINLAAMLSHPFSRGSVHIKSSDATVKPALDFGYYTHPLDLEIHARHYRALEQLVQTEPLASAVKKGGARLPAGHDALSIERGKSLITEHASTNYHPCGSCSMMPEEMGGVVDERLRVYGTQNVRVVDASIMPIIPRGNIITTVYAVAEKAADLVLEDLKMANGV